MKTDPQMLFYGWLCGCLPADTKTIRRELAIGRRKLHEAYEGFPFGRRRVLAALGELAKKRLVEDVNGTWHWRAERVKVEPTLF